jgi:hypothetical protein
VSHTSTLSSFSVFGIIAAGIIAVPCTSGCSGSNNSSAAGSTGGAATSGGTSAAKTGTSATGGIMATGGISAAGGVNSTGVTNPAGGTMSSGGTNGNGGTTPLGGTTSGGGASATGGTTSVPATGGSKATGGSSGVGGTASTGGSKAVGGSSATGGSKATGGNSAVGGSTNTGGSKATGGTTNAGGSSTTGGAAGCASGPIGTFTGALADGINFLDTDGKRVNAHGGGIIKEGDTYYMHGEYFLSTTTDNNFNGFSMYSSKDLATWKNEGIILPQQASGELGPTRKGERPHIIKCPSTGEFVLYAHAASEDYSTDREVVYATSTTVNGKYSYKGPLTNASGATAAHSDMSALSDGNNAYVITESGHVYTLASDCHSWLSDKSYSALNGDSGGSESPTVFKAGSTYYWIGSYKTGWRANNNFYATASAMTGPWTHQGFIAPVTDTSTVTPSGSPNPPEWISDQRTWLSQSTWVTPVVGCQGTVYVYWGDHWYGNTDTSNPGRHNDQATYVFQPLVFSGTSISMPTYLSTWKLDVGAGTWSQ